MDGSAIDYDTLKKRGFLKQRQEGYFLLRTRTIEGSYSSAQLAALMEVAKTYGKDILHPTLRQGLEIPFIRFEDIEAVAQILSQAGVPVGTSGPRLRPTTACPGTNWCQRGLIDTFGLFKRMENELGLRCAYDLPHKFKIAISGCPNCCTRAESADIGVHGVVDTSHPERRKGYVVYLGGCGGRNPRFGIKCEKVFTEDQVLDIIERAVRFYKDHGKSRQRLALLIEEFGREKFLEEIKPS